MYDGLPVVYASNIMSSSQINYAQIEKEILDALLAYQRFYQYICGKANVIVEIDHSLW